VGEKKDEKPKGTSRDEESNGGQAVGGRHFESLAGWAAIAVVALLVCILGTLVLAWCASEASEGHRPKAGPICQGHECHEQERRSVCPPHSLRPAEEGGDLTLIVNVAGGAVSQQAQTGTPPCPACPQPTNDNDMADSGGDLIVVVDREKVVEQEVREKETVVKTEKVETKERVETKEIVKPPPPCPEPRRVCTEPVGRVRFEPARRRVRYQRQEVLDIAERMQDRSGTVLVVGYPDRGKGPRQARRRAKKVGKALREALEERTGVQLPVLARATSTDPARAGENLASAERHYGTAVVYLIEGLP